MKCRVSISYSNIILMNLRTDRVGLWDNKYRSGSTTGKVSPTFEKDNTRASAVREAIEEIEEAKFLSSGIKNKAIDNLQRGNFTTYTVGSGKVRTSVIQKYCNNQKCSD